MKRKLLLGLATLFLALGVWAGPAAASSFDGAHLQRATQHPRRHHHRARRHHHHRVHRGA